VFDSAYISRERTIFVYYQFFKKLLKRFGRKLIFTDGARWYNDACKWLRLKHRIYGTELKNVMEGFIQKIKDRKNFLLMITFHVD
jgi:transposase-like protein